MRTLKQAKELHLYNGVVTLGYSLFDGEIVANELEQLQIKLINNLGYDLWSMIFY